MTRFTIQTRLATAAFAIATLATSATAQSIDGRVERNPDDTVTYTIDLDGPPRGRAAVLMGLDILPAPLHIPGLGNFHLDPFFLLSTPSVQLDQNGHGRLQLTAPAQATDDIPICFQGVFVDAQPTWPVVRLGLNFCKLNQAAAVNLPESFAMGWTAGEGCGAQIWGQAGDNFTILIKDAQGNVVAQRNVQVGANGTTGYQNFPLPGLGEGWSYEVWKDIGHGHVTQSWRGDF